MKFIVMQCWVDSEGNVGTPVQNFDNEADAWSRYHGILSSAAKSNYPQHGAIIMNQDLFQLEKPKIFFHEPTPEQEPTPEPNEGVEEGA